MTTSSDRSLQDLFYDVRALCSETPNGTEWHQSLRLCRELVTAVDAAQLFSPNESADEVATAHLKFFLAPLLEARLLAHCPTLEPETKTAVLQDSLDRYQTFLATLWTYQLCGEAAQKLFRDEEDLMKGGRKGGVPREQKIARFKRERWLQTEIDRMRDAKTAVDEEWEREIWCLELEMAFLKALSERETLRQELEIVTYAASSHRRTNVSSEHSEKASQAKVTTVIHGLAQNIQKRESLKKEVFRPSHIFPTMTVEEFGKIEYQRAMEQQKSRAARDVKEEASGEEEEDVYKARAWDDWKDDHPRGYGNSKLKPCS